ncbi:hypothetical protein HIM_03592 [Hirsutella minnesotensis 3608]|uniref:Uncharacterized protein n=1 Tax=Hirsutella minnesotensis 3608 TaxID=1043627 RepID=A0A0F7ZMI6_9HYPO|nr:hypothetical protein HIM_03592 [Hirsutella minnesotensis 3608]
MNKSGLSASSQLSRLIRSHLLPEPSDTPGRNGRTLKTPRAAAHDEGPGSWPAAHGNPVHGRGPDGAGLPKRAPYAQARHASRRRRLPLGFDAIYGGCEGAAEGAALFAPQLIRAYPDAKVVVAVRDFDGWRRSVEDVVFRGLWCPLADLFVRFVEPTLGIVTISTMRKGNLGFYEARDADEARRNARMAYDRHHRVIQQMVPPEQLLFYKMGQGWEPLCEFLGKPVPDKPFPQSNEARGLKVQATKFFLVAFAMASWRRVSYLWRPILLGLGLWVAAAKVFRVT